MNKKSFLSRTAGVKVKWKTVFNKKTGTMEIFTTPVAGSPGACTAVSIGMGAALGLVDAKVTAEYEQHDPIEDDVLSPTPEQEVEINEVNEVQELGGDDDDRDFEVE